jgi:F-type H+-transporting ATPase subunit delta
VSRGAVARNYAETLYALAERDGSERAYMEMLGEVASLYGESATFRSFLLTPRIAAAAKRRVLRESFAERYPETFIRFLLVALEKRRQGLLPEIDAEYREILYEKTGRVHASVSLPFESDEAFRAELERDLAKVLGGRVSADFRTDERLIGGLVVRVKDRVLDGSVRRKLQLMRRALLDEGTAGWTGLTSPELQRMDTKDNGDV